MKKLLLILVPLLLAAAGDRFYSNTNQDKNITIQVNDGGTVKDAIKVTGSTGAVTLGTTGETTTHTVNGSISTTGNIVVGGTNFTESAVFGMTGSAVNLWDFSSLANGSAIVVICARSAGAATKAYGIANLDGTTLNVSQIVTGGVTLGSSGKILQATGTNGHNLLCSYSRLQ